MNKLVLPLMMHRRKKGKDTYVVPTWNHLYKIIRNRPTLDTYAKKHYETLRNCANTWTSENDWVCVIDQKVIARVWVYFPDKRKRDTHNLTKIFDALQGIIVNDDYYFLIQFQDFFIDKENPRIEIEFELKGV